MGQKPLHLAVLRGDNHRMVEILLNRGALNNCKNRDEDTALHLACRRDDVKTVKVLDLHGADWEAVNIFRQTPLSIVKNLGSLSEVYSKVLLKKHNTGAKKRKNK